MHFLCTFFNSMQLSLVLGKSLSVLNRELTVEIKISIIIPVYNVEKYLRECLDSILNQTFQEFEIICTDDGSTDKSLEILEEYKRKDDRFVILQQRHFGAGAARNNGIKLAKGKYIMFLDADDYFEPTLLEEMYERADKYDADLTVCSSKKVDDDGNVTETGSPNFPINIDKVPLERIFNREEFKDNIFSLFSPVIWNKLIKKSFLKENNLEFPPLTIYEDIAFVHSLMICANRIVAFNKELVNYRFNRPHSLASMRSKHTIDAVKSCMYLGDFLKTRGFLPEYENAYKEVFINHIRAEISYCNDDEYKKFLQEFKALLPNDWQKYQSALKKDYITPTYLKKFIGNKKVMLWGGSLFIGQVLEKETEKNPNILGIIDRNAASAGKPFCNYTIYPPEAINELKPDGVILTVLSNNEFVYESLKEEFKEKYPNVELLPNIFEEELKF